MPCKVISLDGGGLHALVSLRLLQRLEAEQPFIDEVDCFAGTSSGGISALILAALNKPSAGLQRAIDFWSQAHYFVLNVPRVNLTPLCVATYTNRKAVQDLSALFADLRLSQLKRSVVIPSFRLDSGANRLPRRWSPYVNINFGDFESLGLRNEYVRDVALRTSAAPLGFPIYQGFIDGGVFANNPAMCAVSEILGHYPGNPGIGDISMLSVGGGLKPQYIESVDGDWGVNQWLLDPKALGVLLEMVFNAGVEAVSDQARHILGAQRFFRLNPPQTELLPSTNAWLPFAEIDLMPKAVRKQLDFADTVNIEPTLDWIRSTWLA